MMRFLKALRKGFIPTLFIYGFGIYMFNLVVNVWQGNDYMDFLVFSMVLVLFAYVIGDYRLSKEQGYRTPSEQSTGNDDRFTLIVSFNTDGDIDSFRAYHDVTEFIRNTKWTWEVSE